MTELTTAPEQNRVDAAIAFAVSEFDKTLPMVEQVREDCSQIVVNGPDDKSGMTSAEVAIARVKRLRINTDKQRKEYNAEPQRYIKAVNAKAKEIQDEIAPLEQYLKEQIEGATVNVVETLKPEPDPEPKEPDVKVEELIHRLAFCASSALAEMNRPEWSPIVDRHLRALSEELNG